MSRFLIMLVTLGFAAQLTAAQTPAQQAYRLRMQGRIEKAKTLLDQTLKQKPNDSMAYYELARTQYHMALGKPRELDDHLTAAGDAIAQAIKLDNQPVMYHTFAGHLAYIRTYKALMQHQPTLKERFAEVCDAYEMALQRKPDYPEVLLYLVELHAVFPEEAGADRAQAEQYAQRLEALAPLWSHKASSILQPESSTVKSWQALLEDRKQARPAVLEELGKCYLSDDHVDAAQKCFNEAVQRDAAKAYLYLDLSIYHTWQCIKAGENVEQRQACARLGLAAIRDYLSSQPSQPMRAYALGVQSKYQGALGEREAARASFQEAQQLDPYFSKATGLPHPDLFIPLSEVSHNHRYLMRPY